MSYLCTKYANTNFVNFPTTTLTNELYTHLHVQMTSTITKTGISIVYQHIHYAHFNFNLCKQQIQSCCHCVKNNNKKYNQFNTIFLILDYIVCWIM